MQNRLLMVVYFCLCWFGIAWVVFWGTIDNIDVDGTLKKVFQPYETTINLICISGMIALPTGLLLGLFGCFTKPPERRVLFVPPMVISSLI